MKKIVIFTAEGRGKFTSPKYTMVDEEECQNSAEVAALAAKAICRKSGYDSVITLRHAYWTRRGVGASEEVTGVTYVSDIGNRCPCGGFSPEAQVWIHIDLCNLPAQLEQKNRR